MNALLMAAALDTVVAPLHEEVYVHEWGVLTYRSDVVEATGSADGPWSNPSDMVAEAPVIHIYGPEFSGDLTVRSAGRIFSTYPDPDERFDVDVSVAGGGSAVRWSGIETRCPWLVEPDCWSSSCEVDIDGFFDALPLWRRNEALVLTRESDGFCDKFLYYEVDLAGRFPDPLSPSCPGGPSTGEALFFQRTDGVVTVAAGDVGMLYAMEESLPFTASYDAGFALETVAGWASPYLKRDEIEEMWATWEPYVLYGDWEGSTLAVFPLRQDLVERISTLELTVDEPLDISYHRFFLVLMEN
jgi:hypothetical protein